ncbi:hypothetical protein GCK32_002853 [Trichostrongylus colubriformis]|uniref:Chitin-binding type-2 domain-containing protein n=1 Tax=Trichostrongylus colubriformis TaxID=6319 RepID=A0AAN8EUX5_TRICO
MTSPNCVHKAYTKTSTVKTYEETSTTSAPVVPTDVVYKSAHSAGGYSVPTAPAQQYPSRNNPYGSSMYNPFAMLYSQFLPMGTRDAMHGRGKVNHGPINFQSRSMLAGGFRSPVRDIFDGVVSPSVQPGIDRVFGPNMHKRHRPRDRDDEYHGPRGIDISPPLEQADEVVSESPGVFEAISDRMRLENAVPQEDEEHTDLYGMSCSSEFVYCNDGVAQPMKGPSALVFNQALGYGDYTEDCSSAHGLRARSQQSAHSQRLPSVEPTKSVSLSICAMRKDGFYAEKCSADFVSCKQGAATPMRCPSGLLFKDEKGYCGYPEDCASDHSPSAQGAPTSSPPFDCKEKKNGYYSNGCVADFVYCVNEVASPMACPTSLVYNERKGHCDYAENSAVGPAPVRPAPTPVRSMPAPSVKAQLPPTPTYAPPVSSSIDCKGRKDGYYSSGCVAECVYCVDGPASPMTCLTSLAFNENTGYYDYPENCSTGPAQAIPVPAVVPPAQTAFKTQFSVASAYDPLLGGQPPAMKTWPARQNLNKHYDCGVCAITLKHEHNQLTTGSVIITLGYYGISGGFPCSNALNAHASHAPF